ncbi:MAG TPA: avidin/streptavidin family protein [Stellaceae bacterium]|nr:avidin/streptavidin family protein [Stellaceae bacterium]
MLKRANVILCVGLGLFCVLAASPAHAQALWTWTNQRGSLLVVTNFDSNTGAITGTYTNNASGSCDVGTPQAMTGWLAHGSGTAISVSVNWLGCGSTTVWTGQLDPSANFQGMWFLSLASPPAWNGVNAGADTFTFQSGDKGKLMKP